MEIGFSEFRKKVKNRLPELPRQLKVLQKRWVLIATITCSFLGLTFIGTMITTPIYKAEALILIERVAPDNLTGKINYQREDPDFDKTQYQIIRGNSVARRVVALLTEPIVLAEAERLGWSYNVKEEGAAQANQISWTKSDFLAASLAKNIKVQPVTDSQITSIAYYSPSPEFAAQAANMYVKGYLEETLEMKLDATRRNVDWMTQKAEAEREKLQESEKRLQKFMVLNNLMTIDDRLPETFSQLSRDLVQAETKTKELQLLYQKVQSVADDMDAAESLLSTTESSTLDVLRAEILKSEQNINEFANKYGSKHPIMIKAIADLEALKERRREEIARIIQKVGNQYNLAKANEDSLRHQLNKTKADALGMNEKYVQYTALKRELETNRTLYNALIAKIKDQSITGESQPVNIWVIESAKVPYAPFRPIYLLNLSLGLIIGLCCGVGWVLLFERFDDRIKSPDGLDEFLGIPTLGSVTLKRSPQDMSGIVLTAPRSVYAESFNALNTTVLLSSADSPPKRIMITSSIAGEGKSTTAVNLALSMAKNGSGVLLLDCDLRKGSLHDLLELPNNIGLSSYLAGTASEQAILCKGSHENLAVITSGPIPPNPYQLLNSGRFASLLKKFQKDFDFLICDAPPVLLVPDPRVLSKYFDATIIVVRADLATYKMVAKSIYMLKHINTNIIGTFVNGVQEKEQEYYSHYSSYLGDFQDT